MTDLMSERTRDDATPPEKKLEDLFELVDETGTCMFTTRRADGYLVSRPMEVQLRTEEGIVWFVTDEDTAKLDELESDPHVNLAFYRPGSREWVSLSGTARLSHDREKIRALHKTDWRVWFGDEGGARNGGPDDPRLVLIRVEPRTVTYLKDGTPRPLALYQMAKDLITGDPPQTGDLRTLGPGDLGATSGERAIDRPVDREA